MKRFIFFPKLGNEVTGFHLAHFSSFSRAHSYGNQLPCWSKPVGNGHIRGLSTAFGQQPMVTCILTTVRLQFTMCLSLEGDPTLLVNLQVRPQPRVTSQLSRDAWTSITRKW